MLQTRFLPGDVRWKVGLLAMGVTAMSLLTVAQDAAEAFSNQTGFYLSESALFSSFWLFFIPFLSVQYKLSVSKQLKGFPAFLLVMGLHLAAYPVWIWVLSAVFYEQTFAYGQTLLFVGSEYSYVLVLIYGSAAISLHWYKPHIPGKNAEEAPMKNTLSHLLVSSAGRYHSVATNDILYIQAASPYVIVHLDNKEYLHSDTLKALSGKLDDTYFVRIHKTTLVNLFKIKSYQSRLNGDYDIQMQDGSQIRLSRTYARLFKAKMRQISSSGHTENSSGDQ